jgi:hypothetical protein
MSVPGERSIYHHPGGSYYRSRQSGYAYMLARYLIVQPRMIQLYRNCPQHSCKLTCSSKRTRGTTQPAVFSTQGLACPPFNQHAQTGVTILINICSLGLQRMKVSGSPSKHASTPNQMHAPKSCAAAPSIAVVPISGTKAWPLSYEC